MSGREHISITGRALWLITPFISLVIITGVLVMFEYFRSTTKEMYLEQIEFYVKERIARERILFQLAESHLAKIQDKFIQRFNSLETVDYEQRFSGLMQKETDGAWRNNERFADLNEYSGNFIDDDSPVTPDLKKKMVIFSDLTNQYGPAWHGQYPNLFIIGQENYMSVFWPEVHWARFADTSLDLTRQKNYFHDPESDWSDFSPAPAAYEQRQSLWTDVYYDNVSRKWLISNIAPLYLNQQQIGTVGHDLYLNELFQRTLNDNYPGAFNFVFTRQGRVIVHPELMERLFLTEGQLTVQDAGFPLLTEAFQRSLSGNLWQAYESADEDYFLVMSHLAEPDWFFVAAYPRQAITDLALNKSQVVLFMGLCSLLIMLSIVYWVMKYYVARPLQQFIWAAHSVAEGDRNIWLDDSRQDELGQLATSFLNMQKAIRSHTSRLTCEIYEKNLVQKKLQQVNDELELRVQQRTASLEQANQELSLTLEQLREAQGQLVEAEKMSSLGGLVAGVAHEINTPIGICLTAASGIQDDLEKLKTRYQAGRMSENDFTGFLVMADEAMSILISNNQRASQLIQSFKQVAVDQSSEECRRFALKAYIEEILFSLRPRLKRTRHQIALSCEDGIEMKSYPGALSQVLTNLVMNSLLHGFDGIEQGLIQIDVVQQDQSLTLTYRDNGVGMDEQGLQKIFEPFYTTRRGNGGSGLGAHLVYNLVTQKLRGSIHCTSAKGQGVCFVLRLPSCLTEDTHQQAGQIGSLNDTRSH